MGGKSEKEDLGKRDNPRMEGAMNKRKFLRESCEGVSNPKEGQGVSIEIGGKGLPRRSASIREAFRKIVFPIAYGRTGPKDRGKE